MLECNNCHKRISWGQIQDGQAIVTRTGYRHTWCAKQAGRNVHDDKHVADTLAARRHNAKIHSRPTLPRK